MILACGRSSLLLVDADLSVFPDAVLPSLHTSVHTGTQTSRSVDFWWEEMTSLAVAGNIAFDVKHRWASYVRNTGLTICLIFFSKFSDTDLSFSGSPQNPSTKHIHTRLVIRTQLFTHLLLIVSPLSHLTSIHSPRLMHRCCLPVVFQVVSEFYDKPIGSVVILF